MKRFKLFKSLISQIRNISDIEVMEKAEGAEIIHEYYGKELYTTITIKEAPIWLLNPDDRGYYKMVPITRKKNPTERETYVLSESEKRFIEASYVKYHLEARQMVKASARIYEDRPILMEAIFRYIRHEKLKPNYDDVNIKKPSKNNRYTNMKEFEIEEYHPKDKNENEDII